VFDPFTRSHRGGAGPPLVALHGFTDTWRTWALVLPALERRHDVLAPTLPGHAGGPPLDLDAGAHGILATIEEAMDAAGFAAAHLVGNSLGGYLALRLAERGRALSVTALAPAGGWAAGDESVRDTLGQFAAMQAALKALAPNAAAFLSTPAGRRQATRYVAERYEHIPSALIAHMLLGVAACSPVGPMIDLAAREGWQVDAAAIRCPVRVVWGTADALLPWPRAAARYRAGWLPHADWVVLDDVGHCPQLDVPAEAAALIPSA
jgi:pimeloyl-ACP methyl ester carboxylesterase